VGIVAQTEWELMLFELIAVFAAVLSTDMVLRREGQTCSHRDGKHSLPVASSSA
jgi:hypothetical protein